MYRCLVTLRDSRSRVGRITYSFAKNNLPKFGRLFLDVPRPAASSPSNHLSADGPGSRLACMYSEQTARVAMLLWQAYLRWPCTSIYQVWSRKNRGGCSDKVYWICDPRVRLRSQRNLDEIDTNRAKLLFRRHFEVLLNRCSDMEYDKIAQRISFLTVIWWGNFFCPLPEC